MKKLFAALLAVMMVLTLAACAPKDDAPAGTAKSFTVTVVHADGTEKEFSYETTEEKLGAYLEAQGLIQSEGADDGMFHTVDGEQAIYETDKAYWAFYEGEEYAMTGIYDTAITDGATYKLVYTPA